MSVKAVTDMILGLAKQQTNDQSDGALVPAFEAVLKLLDERAKGNQRLTETLDVVRQAVGLPKPQTEQPKPEQPKPETNGEPA